MLIDTDGTTSDMLLHSEAPQAVLDIVARTLRRSTFRPATYGGTPYPAVAEMDFQFELE